MPRHIHLEPQLTDDELHDGYRREDDPVERSRWHFLWLLVTGMTATSVASVTGYSAYWNGRISNAITPTARTECETGATTDVLCRPSSRPQTAPS